MKKLSEEQIKKNATIFFNRGKKYGALTDELIKDIGEELIKAPASSSINDYCFYEGGLIEHIITISKYAYKIYETLPNKLKFDINSLMKVSLLHQIGKYNMYVPTTSSNLKLRGIYYEFNNNNIPMNVPQKTIFLCLKYNIKLTEEEYLAILNYNKENIENNKLLYYQNNILLYILQFANELAIIENKNKNEK